MFAKFKPETCKQGPTPWGSAGCQGVVSPSLPSERSCLLGNMTWSLSPQCMPRSLRWCVQEVVGCSPQLEESGGVRKAPWLAQRGLRERAYPSRCSVRASGRLQTRSPVSGTPLWLNLSQPSVVLASMVLGPSSFLHMSCICRFHTSKAPRWPQVWGRAFNTAPLNVFSPSGISGWGGQVGWQ